MLRAEKDGRVFPAAVSLARLTDADARDEGLDGHVLGSVPTEVVRKSEVSVFLVTGA